MLGNDKSKGLCEYMTICETQYSSNCIFAKVYDLSNETSALYIKNNKYSVKCQVLRLLFLQTHEMEKWAPIQSLVNLHNYWDHDLGRRLEESQYQ